MALIHIVAIVGVFAALHSGTARPAIGSPGADTWALDAKWPADLSKIGPMNGTSGVDVDPVKGEVYMCQQRGSPRVSVWDSKTGKLLRSWGDDVLDTPHGIRLKPSSVKSGDVEVWIMDMGVGLPDTGNVIRVFSGDGKLLRTIGTPGNEGSGLDPVQFSHVADIDWSKNEKLVVAVDGDGGLNNRVVALDAATSKVAKSWGDV